MITSRCPVVDHWISRPEYDYLEGHFHYDDTFMHARCVLLIKPHCLLVVDRAHLTKSSVIRQFFHMPPRVDVNRLDDGAGNHFKYLLSAEGSGGCLMAVLRRPFETVSRVVIGESTPELQGWYAGRARIFEAAPVVEHTVTAGAGDHYFAHLFVPMEAGGPQGYRVELADGAEWDAARGEPLRFTIYEPGRTTHLSLLPSGLFFPGAAGTEDNGPVIALEYEPVP
jgi:hypothetical protein